MRYILIEDSVYRLSSATGVDFFTDPSMKTETFFSLNHRFKSYYGQSETIVVSILTACGSIDEVLLSVAQIERYFDIKGKNQPLSGICTQQNG